MILSNWIISSIDSSDYSLSIKSISSTSFGVEGLDKFNHLALSFVLDLLLFQPQVVIVLVVSTHDHLVEMADYPDLRISLHVILAPFLQLAFLNVNFRFVHYLDIELTILLRLLDLATLSILNKFQHVIAIHNDFLLLLSGHVTAQNLSNNLAV